MACGQWDGISGVRKHVTVYDQKLVLEQAPFKILQISSFSFLKKVPKLDGEITLTTLVGLALALYQSLKAPTRAAVPQPLRISGPASLRF